MLEYIWEKINSFTHQGLIFANLLEYIWKKINSYNTFGEQNKQLYTTRINFCQVVRIHLWMDIRWNVIHFKKNKNFSDSLMANLPGAPSALLKLKSKKGPDLVPNSAPGEAGRLQF